MAAWAVLRRDRRGFGLGPRHGGYQGSLYCFMQAAEELLKAGWKPECDVYLASSCTGNGAATAPPPPPPGSKEHGVRLGMLMDEGGMIMDSPMAGVKAVTASSAWWKKGYADVKFIARSGGGHASAPGRNTALVRIAKFICRVEKPIPSGPLHPPPCARCSAAWPPT